MTARQPSTSRVTADFAALLSRARSRVEVVDGILERLGELGLSALVGRLEDDQLLVLACTVPPVRAAAATAVLGRTLPLLGVGVAQAAINTAAPATWTATECRRLLPLLPADRRRQLTALGLGRGAAGAAPLETGDGSTGVLLVWGPPWRPRLLPLLEMAAAHQVYAWRMDRGPVLAPVAPPASRSLFSQPFSQPPEPDRLEAAVRPVARLIDGAVVGYEGLCGFAPTLRFHGPAELAAAVAPELRARVEEACCGRVLPLLGLVGPGALFLRLSLSGLVADRGRIPAQLRGAAVPPATPAQLVIELDAAAIAAHPRLAARVVAGLRDWGMRVAIADAGDGPVHLAELAALRPDYLVAGRRRIAGIDESAVRRAVLVSLLGLSAYTNGRLVARGIETDAELAALMSLGVQFGTGRRLGAPALVGPGPGRPGVPRIPEAQLAVGPLGALRPANPDLAT